ncbi:hypothetical protein HDU97_005284 [Phlyctochytrium planicorne]|nr:hypothetical protein HDU97_005284 [Phlyctochytrium planicorne]
MEKNAWLQKGVYCRAEENGKENSMPHQSSPLYSPLQQHQVYPPPINSPWMNQGQYDAVADGEHPVYQESEVHYREYEEQDQFRYQDIDHHHPALQDHPHMLLLPTLYQLTASSLSSLFCEEEEVEEYEGLDQFQQENRPHQQPQTSTQAIITRITPGDAIRNLFFKSIPFVSSLTELSTINLQELI